MSNYDAVFNVAVCRIFGLLSSRILSTLRSPIICTLCHLTIQAMRGAFDSAGVDRLDDAWATAFVDHLARYGGAASVRSAHSWLATALAEIISEAHGVLGVDVEVLTDPTMLVQLPNRDDDIHADVDYLHCHGIRGSKLALDAALVSVLFGVSSPLSHVLSQHGNAIRRAERTKFDNYSEGVKSRPGIRLISFAVTEFDAFGGYATTFFDRDGHVGSRLLRDTCGHDIGFLSLAVHVAAQADNASRGLSAAADGVEATFSSAGFSSHATAFFTRAMGRRRPHASSSGA
jgi:hypothetical protein